LEKIFGWADKIKPTILLKQQNRVWGFALFFVILLLRYWHALQMSLRVRQSQTRATGRAGAACNDSV